MVLKRSFDRKGNSYDGNECTFYKFVFKQAEISGSKVDLTFLTRKIENLIFKKLKELVVEIS